MTEIHNRRDARKWQEKYDVNAPKVGALAPDFTLFETGGEYSLTLSALRGQRPVALVFGSFTWPPYVKGTVSLRELYAQHHNQVQFLSVYIREAHPKDGWWMGSGLFGTVLKLSRSKAATDIYDPQTLDERRHVAASCAAQLDYGIPTLVDDMEDSVNKAYAAWPTRLYLIGLDGRVVYAGGLGPFGFEPDELGHAIDMYLHQSAPVYADWARQGWKKSIWDYWDFEQTRYRSKFNSWRDTWRYAASGAMQSTASLRGELTNVLTG